MERSANLPADTVTDAAALLLLIDGLAHELGRKRKSQLLRRLTVRAELLRNACYERYNVYDLNRRRGGMTPRKMDEAKVQVAKAATRLIDLLDGLAG